MEKAAESMKRFYDKKHNASILYKEGESVWLDGRNIKTLRPSKKLDQKKLGPFRILKKIGKGSYCLQLPKSWSRIHPVFNKILLSPYHPPAFPSQQSPEPPGPVNMDGHPEYEVEEILGARKRGRGIQYLIKWKDYGLEENTWEPRRNVGNAEELIGEFYEKYPDAVRGITQILETRRLSVDLTLEKIKGVIEAKTNLRKGYCQDLLDKARREE